MNVKVLVAVLVVSWAAICLGAVGTAVLVDHASEQKSAVFRLIRPSPQSPIGPFILEDLLAYPVGDAVRAMRVRAAGAASLWVLSFILLTLGTFRLIRTRMGWVTVQGWHGGRLFLLFPGVAAASIAFGGLVWAGNTGAADLTLIITSGLILLLTAVLFVRATWSWFGVRSTDRRDSLETAVGTKAAPTAGEPGQVTADVLGQDSRPLTRQWTRVLFRLREVTQPSIATVGWLAAGLLLGVVLSMAVLRRPRTYADCILDGMRYATTAASVRVLQDACRMKYSLDAGYELIVADLEDSGASRQPLRPRSPRRPVTVQP